MASPAGLRSQTPISQTASTPRAASSSQRCSGTLPSVMGAPWRRLSSFSQTQLLISYTMGWAGRVDICCFLATLGDGSELQ